MKKVIEKPKHLQNPRRAFVKRNGKKLVRKIASFQSRQSFVPDSPKIDNKYFPFLKSFTDNWLDIKEEALEVMKFKEVIPGFQDISPDQYRLATENNWKTFVLFGFGKRLEKNSSLAPKTSKLLEAVPNLQTAMFSILAPGYHIPAHSGVTKGILRSHIGLIIPSDYENCMQDLRDQSHALWDLDRFDAEIRESQARRWVIYEALREGGYYPWDYQPLQKASERYMRNHMDLNALEAEKRVPKRT